MGLRASGHAKTLIMLYVVTLVMRAAFYATIASVQNSSYLGGAVSTWDVAVIMMIYPLSELASVSFFGSYSDKIGRRPVLITSLLLTSCATLLFATATSPVFTYGYAVIFGLGAASQVATSLSMIADCSSPFNRARLMGYYDLSTLGGLGGGYGLAMIMLRFGVQAYNVLQLATIASLISVVVAIGIKETRRVQSRDVSVMKLLRKVASDRRIQLLMPVYIPIISLYGLVIANAENIVEEHFSLTAYDFMILFGMLAAALVVGIITMGHLSDYLRKRRPFIVVGLISFGVLAFILVAYSGDIDALWSIWPILPLLGFTAGAFPPAAMAYLTDVSNEEARGSTMGVYSIFFGTGMIIGPSVGAFAYSTYGIEGLGVVVAVLIAIASIGTYFMHELVLGEEEREQD